MLKLREARGDSPAETVKAESAGKNPLVIRRNAFADSSASDRLAVSFDVQDHFSLAKFLYYRNSGLEGKRNVTKDRALGSLENQNGRSNGESK